MVCIAIPLRNYYKIYSREYDQPYGLLVFGSYATGNYFSPKEAIKILREKNKNRVNLPREFFLFLR